MTVDHLNLKLYIQCIVGILQALRIEFLKFKILEILSFCPYKGQYPTKYIVYSDDGVSHH